MIETDCKANNAMILILMTQNIIKCHQQCPVCKGPMQWTMAVQGCLWRCRKRHLVTCSEYKSVFFGCKFFTDKYNIPWIRSTKIIHFFRYIYFRFDYKLDYKGANKAKIFVKTGRKYKYKLFDFLEFVRNDRLIILGGPLCPIEFDGCYYAPKWRPHKGQKKPRNYKKFCIFRIIERVFNKKGRHNQISYIVKAESINECLPLILRHVPDRRTQFFLDGCGLGRGDELRDIYTNVSQCNHKRGIYVKPSSVLEGWSCKTHDAQAENSYKKFRLCITRNYGLKSKSDAVNYKALYYYILEDDFVNNYTNNTAGDYVQTILQFIADYE